MIIKSSIKIYYTYVTNVTDIFLILVYHITIERLSSLKRKQTITFKDSLWLLLSMKN